MGQKCSMPLWSTAWIGKKDEPVRLFETPCGSMGQGSLYELRLADTNMRVSKRVYGTDGARFAVSRVGWTVSGPGPVWDLVQWGVLHWDFPLMSIPIAPLTANLAAVSNLGVFTGFVDFDMTLLSNTDFNVLLSRDQVECPGAWIRVYLYGVWEGP